MCRITSQAFTIFILLATASAQASQNGRNGFSGNPATNSGVTCSVCHAPGAPVPNVTLTGPSVVNAGTSQAYTVTIGGGPGQTGGVNLSAGDGDLAPRAGDLHRIGEELSHITPKAFSAQSVSFSFDWTAPAYNTTTKLYAAGNSSNGALDLLGDGIGTDTLDIVVQNGTVPPPEPPPPAATGIMLVPHTVGLSAPVAIANAGDGRLFVVERAGRIRITARDTGLHATPFLDISGPVDDSGGEMGLLGLAFHPDYARNGYFYVYYTRDPGSGRDRSRIARFSVNAVNPNIANASSERVLLEFEQPYANHNGGDLHFGPDGYLYIASGDGGSGGDPQDYAQNNQSLLGKLLRIDVDSAPGPNNGPDCDISGWRNYRIPSGNAFTNGPGGGCDEVYANGLRNPWRFSFDRQTGDLWIADVGQNAYEEINFVLAGAAGGLNFGWRCFEGKHTFNTDGCNSVYFPPLVELPHATGDCSITGGFVYRGINYPQLQGRYLFTDFCNTAIRTVGNSATGPMVTTVSPAGYIPSPSAFGEGADGELYIASLSQGRIYRIIGSGGIFSDGFEPLR